MSWYSLDGSMRKSGLKYLAQHHSVNTEDYIQVRKDVCICDGLRRTPGLRCKFAVSVDDFKHIGYCVNSYTATVRK